MQCSVKTGNRVQAAGSCRVGVAFLTLCAKLIFCENHQKLVILLVVRWMIICTGIVFLLNNTFMLFSI